MLGLISSRDVSSDRLLENKYSLVSTKGNEFSRPRNYVFYYLRRKKKRVCFPLQVGMMVGKRNLHIKQLLKCNINMYACRSGKC